MRFRALRTSLAFALLASCATADTVRVKTSRGTFLVEINAADIEARAEGPELVLALANGEEVRLQAPEAVAGRKGPAMIVMVSGPIGGEVKVGDGLLDPASKEPGLLILRAGKVVASARRISAPNPVVANPFVSTPGRMVLGTAPFTQAWSVAVSDDGKTLVAGHNGMLRVWDLPGGTERLKVQVPRVVRRVALTPDGLTIASAEWRNEAGKTVGNVVLRDSKTGAVKHEFKTIEGGLHGVTIAPDGKVVVSCSWSETTLRIWDVEKGDQVGTLKGHSGSVGTALFSPDGKTLASAGDTTVRLWDADTGDLWKTLLGHTKSLESEAFSRDGKLLATGGYDRTARVWDVDKGAAIATLDHRAPVLALAFSPDGKTLATASSRWGEGGNYNPSPAEVQLWDIAGSKSILALPEQPAQVFAMTFTPDGKTLVTASLSGAVTCFDLETFRKLKVR